jgi:undecaprenyl-diphosphatase
MTLLIILTASYLYFMTVAVALVAWVRSSRSVKLQLLKLSVLTFPLALVLAQLAGVLYYDPRPFVLEHIRPLIAHAADNGFPSDHTLLCMTVAAVIWVYHRRTGILLGLVGVAVGSARVLAHVHHTVDIVGSTLIGVLATTIVWYLLDRAHGVDNALTRLLAPLSDLVSPRRIG